MKLSHAAALALAMWFVLTPHVGPDGKLQTDKPYWYWYRLGPYGSAPDCEDERNKLVSQVIPAPIEELRKTHENFADGRCVSLEAIKKDKRPFNLGQPPPN
jgi:hypothetical protein